jgi:hypothetical protein
MSSTAITRRLPTRLSAFCTVTWLLIPSEYADKGKSSAMRRFLGWAYQQGMQTAMPLDCGILPESPLERARNQIQKIH